MQRTSILSLFHNIKMLLSLLCCRSSVISYGYSVCVSTGTAKSPLVAPRRRSLPTHTARPQRKLPASSPRTGSVGRQQKTADTDTMKKPVTESRGVTMIRPTGQTVGRSDDKASEETETCLSDDDSGSLPSMSCLKRAVDGPGEEKSAGKPEGQSAHANADDETRKEDVLLMNSDDTTEDPDESVMTTCEQASLLVCAAEDMASSQLSATPDTHLSSKRPTPSRKSSTPTNVTPSRRRRADPDESVMETCEQASLLVCAAEDMLSSQLSATPDTYLPSKRPTPSLKSSTAANVTLSRRRRADPDESVITTCEQASLLVCAAEDMASSQLSTTPDTFLPSKQQTPSRKSSTPANVTPSRRRRAVILDEDSDTDPDKTDMQEPLKRTPGSVGKRRAENDVLVLDDNTPSPTTSAFSGSAGLTPPPADLGEFPRHLLEGLPAKRPCASSRASIPRRPPLRVERRSPHVTGSSEEDAETFDDDIVLLPTPPPADLGQIPRHLLEKNQATRTSPQNSTEVRTPSERRRLSMSPAYTTASTRAQSSLPSTPRQSKSSSPRTLQTSPATGNEVYQILSARRRSAATPSKANRGRSSPSTVPPQPRGRPTGRTSPGQGSSTAGHLSSPRGTLSFSSPGVGIQLNQSKASSTTTSDSRVGRSPVVTRTTGGTSPDPQASVGRSPIPHASDRRSPVTQTGHSAENSAQRVHHRPAQKSSDQVAPAGAAGGSPAVSFVGSGLSRDQLVSFFSRERERGGGGGGLESQTAFFQLAEN